MISKLTNEQGDLVNTGEILNCFHKYYTSMYTSTLTCATEEIEKYLEDLEFPQLTEEKVLMMENKNREGGGMAGYSLFRSLSLFRA